MSPVQLENQELRRHAQGLDPLTLKAKYIRAIHQGDVAFVDALENAPKVLGVLSAELFTEGQAVKLDLSPLGRRSKRWRRSGRLLASCLPSPRTNSRSSTSGCTSAHVVLRLRTDAPPEVVCAARAVTGPTGIAREWSRQIRTDTREAAA